MNQDHAIAGVGGVSATALLTTVLQHFQGVDPATAAAEAGLLVLALGALAGIAQSLAARGSRPAPAAVAVGGVSLPGAGNPPPGAAP